MISKTCFVLGVLALALAPGLSALQEPPEKSSAAGEIPKWRFRDDVTVGPDDKVEPPVLVLRVRPVYAHPIKTTKAHERIALELEVNEQGSVVHAVVTRSLEPGLDADAATAAMKWKFTPARLNGVPKPCFAKAILFYSHGSPEAAPEDGSVTWIDGRWGLQGQIQVDPDDKAERPQILQNVQVPYTESARKRRISGIVILEVRIDAEGRVTDAKVLQSLEPGLDDNAVRAVLQWRFLPARLNGEARASVYKITVNFQVQ
jgi:TonB family protein